MIIQTMPKDHQGLALFTGDCVKVLAFIKYSFFDVQDG